MLTTDAAKLCEKMSPQDEYYAGFLDSKELEDFEMNEKLSVNPRAVVAVPILVCILLLIMGKFLLFPLKA